VNSPDRIRRLDAQLEVIEADQVARADDALKRQAHRSLSRDRFDQAAGRV
jgi:hypothetical protein